VVVHCLDHSLTQEHGVFSLEQNSKRLEIIKKPSLLGFFLIHTNYMQKLPYISKPIIVSQEMCDHNGHMNVNYYYKLFDSVYTDMYCSDLGFDDKYLQSGFSTFTLEDSIRYLREFKLGDKVYPSFYLANLNKKLLHFVGILQNENNELSAIFETVLAHMNLNTRKVTEFNDSKLDTLLEYKSLNNLSEVLPFDLKLKIRDL
jgi:acyl-CoA thioester hydrolase